MVRLKPAIFSHNLSINQHHNLRLTIEITDNPVPSQRAQKILNQFQGFFEAEIIAQLPDLALALLVGVLPQTVREAR
ncbi:MAG: hypothetical protein ABI417_01220 [Coleofasciculaceae cyanobacterium]